MARLVVIHKKAKVIPIVGKLDALKTEILRRSTAEFHPGPMYHDMHASLEKDDEIEFRCYPEH